MTKKEMINYIKSKIVEKYKDAQTELAYENDFELLIAIILSAQCTDKRVNIITPSLFEKYPNAIKLAIADIDDIKNIIKTCSFFNNKASNLIKMAQRVVSNFDNKIPQTQKELISLAGVGQKTANVFMSEYLGQNFMAVDTHVFRVSHRLNLSKSKTVEKTEADLVKIFKTDLNILHQGFVLFGRYICIAKKPNCKECFLEKICKSKDKTI
jgi:endonuclease-3